MIIMTYVQRMRIKNLFGQVIGASNFPSFTFKSRQTFSIKFRSGDCVGQIVG